MSYNNSSFETINALARQAFEADGGVHWDAQDECVRTDYLVAAAFRYNQGDQHDRERPRIDAGKNKQIEEVHQPAAPGAKQ